MKYLDCHDFLLSVVNTGSGYRRHGNVVFVALCCNCSGFSLGFRSIPSCAFVAFVFFVLLIFDLRVIVLFC